MAKVFLECQLLYSLEKANKAWENYTLGNNANRVVVLWWAYYVSWSFLWLVH